MKMEDSAAILRFEHVSLEFDGAVALQDVSFSVAPGETRVILGAAGSGKTTLLKTSVGLVRPDSGHVWLFGQDVTQMKEPAMFELRRRVGVLFQEGGLFDSLTIEENVAYPLVNARAANARPERASITERKVTDALRFVELEHTLDKFPSELSGGMRRRVGIARAVVTDPPLVLYDSPTAGLDPITANTIIALIVKARDVRNTAALMVTHRYQDGQLVANFRYNSKSGRLEPASSNGDGSGRAKTLFMVMNEGRLVFEGTETGLHASKDSYVSKFVKR
ncbi:MAG: ATP-binding cassette domain-containing protein [Bryobacteraceae bacterium]